MPLVTIGKLLFDVDTNRSRRVSYIFGWCSFARHKSLPHKVWGIKGRTIRDIINSKMVDNRLILKDDEQINEIIAFTDGIKEINTFTSTKNVQTSTGLVVSIGTKFVHNHLINHYLPYTSDRAPKGKWEFSGLHEIKKKSANQNPAFEMPDCVSNFYRSMRYEYLLDTGNVE